MFKRLIILICGVLMTCTATAASAATVTKLKNGLTVLIQEDKRFPLVSTRLYVHAGSGYEEPREAGISHVLEHMVFKGTKNYAKGEIAASIEELGGYLNAATSFDYTVYIADLPADAWKTGLKVLRDQAFFATIDAEELESEKKVIISELERGEDSPFGLLFKKLQQQTMKGTTYAWPIIGYRETINSFTREDITNYIKKHYQPQQMLLVVCGDIDSKAVLAEAENLYGNFENTANVTPPSVVDINKLDIKGPNVQIVEGKWNKVYLGISFPIPGFEDVNTTGIDMLAQLMGGDKTSPFYRKYQYEKQLVDSISASAYSFERAGLIYITAVLDADKLDEFWPELMKDLQNLKASEFKDEDIARVRLNLEDSLFRAKETLSGLTSKIGMFEFFFDGEQGEQNYLEEIQNVNREQLQMLIDTYLKPERLQATVLAPQESTISETALTAQVVKNWEPKQTADKAIVEKDLAGEKEVIDLGNGRQLILIPDNTLPYVAIDMDFMGGDTLITKKQSGLSVLAARVLTKGTGSLDAPAVEEFLADRASSIAASASRRTFSVSARYPARFSDDILKLFSQMVQNPTMAAEEVDREKTDQIAGIKLREDQPLGLATRNLFPFLFTDSIYSYYHAGIPAQVEAFTQKDVNGFWKKQKAMPWVMAVAGEFDRDAIIEFAKQLPTPTEKRPEKFVPEWNTEHTKDIALKDRNQAHLFMIFETVPLTNKDTAGLELMQTILAGQSGLIFNDLRDKHGLGYTVTASSWQSTITGFTYFYIGTEPEKEKAAMDGFRRIIKEIQTKPLSQEQIKRGQNLMRGQYYRGHQSLGSRSAEAAGLATAQLPLTYNKDIVEQAQKLTPQDIQDIAKKYLNPDNAYILRVAP
ncbi:M16 family metallopeptidase [Halodesulfovibrio spirochaetisodalis]|uniref:Peptidase M16 n=1 Tax=Halodesulfovibrio spirochaetisodalis TaxID=1560234 RepID=A0A1B7XQ59_9BACT|nr:pitrilysin family protein [Halodesulfovibrio spirochaetisodalis]OBQ57651.1 peptidase M16 [Halodesulfovibrio spirochaetisodalis]